MIDFEWSFDLISFIMGICSIILFIGGLSVLIVVLQEYKEEKNKGKFKMKNDKELKELKKIARSVGLTRKESFEYCKKIYYTFEEDGIIAFIFNIDHKNYFVNIEINNIIHKIIQKEIEYQRMFKRGDENE